MEGAGAVINSIRGTLLAGALLCALFWVPAQFVASGVMIEVANALLFGTSISAAVVWSWTAVQAGRRGIANARELFILGLFLGQAVLAARGLWSLAFRNLGQPAWMLDSATFGFMSYLLAISSALYIFAPGVASGEVPPKNWVGLIVAAAIGAAVFGFVLGAHLRPSVAP